MDHFTKFDMAILIITGLLGLRCMMRGFIKEIGTLAGLIGGVILSRMFGGAAAGLFKSMHNDMLARALGTGLVFFAVTVAASIVSWILTRLTQKSIIGTGNRLGGLALGIFQGIAISGVFVMIVVAVAGTLENSFLKESILSPHILAFMRLLTGLLIGAHPQKAALLTFMHC